MSVGNCAHVVPSASLPTTGPGSYVHLVWELSTTLDVDQTIVCRSDFDSASHAVVDGVDVRSVPRPHWSKSARVGLQVDRLSRGRTSLSADNRYFRDLARAAAEIDPDTTVVWGNAAVLPFVRRELPATRLVFAQRHFNTPGRVTDLQSADVVAFLSPAAVRYALNRLGTFSFIPLVIPNAVETELFRPRAPDSGPTGAGAPPAVIFPSTLTEYKGAHCLAEWLSGASSFPEVEWLVPNRFHPSCGRRLRRRLEEALRTHPRVTWLDGVGRAEMPDLYRRALLTLLPITRQEGFGLAALESMSTCVPVVSTDVPALNEFIDHGRTGYLVPIEQVLSQTPAIVRRALDERDEIDSVGRAARSFVVQHFSRTEVLEAFESLLAGRIDQVDAGYFSARPTKI